jgi:hypothetical protein
MMPQLESSYLLSLAGAEVSYLHSQVVSHPSLKSEHKDILVRHKVYTPVDVAQFDGCEQSEVETSGLQFMDLQQA